MISALCTSVLQALELLEPQWLKKFKDLKLSVMKRLEDGEENLKKKHELQRE